MPDREQTVRVTLANEAYEIHVGAGLLQNIGTRIAGLTSARAVAVISDRNVASHFSDTVRRSLASAGLTILAECVIPEGEQNKSFAQIVSAYDVFLRAKIERSTPIIALGGGVIGDMTGFVAATILRGVPFVQVPTTLLAMVDASVGGKTGVNHVVGKNLIGAFHQPIAVFADPEVLRTLPRRELIGGLAECIKHEIIRDAEGFAALEKNIDATLRLDMDVLTALIAHNVQIKAKVVESDPFERGERAHLNFGHTFGHAIEKVSDFSYSHGESVALGMVAAVNLAVDLKMLESKDKDRIIALIERAGLPTSGLTLDVRAVHEAMAFDKKVKSSRIRLILPDRIGHVVIRDDVPADAVFKAIKGLR
jgi:3-dehydroquinate synthase